MAFHEDARQFAQRWARATPPAAGAALVGMQCEVEERPWSKVARIVATWDPPEAGPGRLIVKRVAHRGGVPSEVAFYDRDYVEVPDAPLPTCFASHVGDDAYTLLLEDVSATHVSGFEIAPDAERAAGVARSLAILHAAFPEVAAEPDQPGRFVAHCRQGLALAVAAAPEHASMFERTFAEIDVRLARRLAKPGLTLLHGDPSPGNVLYARESGGVVRLIDRQPLEYSLQVGPPGWELALLMAQHWHPAERRAHEELVLATYLAERANRGAPVEPEALRRDFREGVLVTVANAVEWMVDPEDREQRESLWRMFFERAAASWADLIDG